MSDNWHWINVVLTLFYRIHLSLLRTSNVMLNFGFCGSHLGLSFTKHTTPTSQWLNYKGLSLIYVICSCSPAPLHFHSGTHAEGTIPYIRHSSCVEEREHMMSAKASVQKGHVSLHTFNWLKQSHIIKLNIN